MTTEQPQPTTEAAGGASAVDLSVRTLNGDRTNPRWLLWEVWHGLNPNMRPHDYIIWIGERWREWAVATKNNLRFTTDAQHKEFDAWLLLWVRGEVIRTVNVGNGF